MPEDIIDFASRAHTAFPNVPCLGVDVIREESTGKLYALEVHASGGTFHLTSWLRDHLREGGIDLRAQFGGATAVARGIHRRLIDHSARLPSASIRSVSKEVSEKRTAGNA